jgi:hypothetical protein
VSTSIGVIGILFGITFYLRSRQRARLAYQLDEVTLTGGRNPAFPRTVEIHFNGTPVPRITVSRVVVWNCGEKTISGSDVVDDDPLRICLPEGAVLLEHLVRQRTRDVNRWHAEPTGGSANRILLKFGFLDPGDGVVIEAVHSGRRGVLSVAGTVRGMPKGLRNYGSTSWDNTGRNPFVSYRIVFAVGVVLGFLMMLVGIVRPQLAVLLPQLFGPKQPDPSHYERINWVLVAAGFVYGIMALMMLWIRRRRYPSTLDAESPVDASEGKDVA